MNWHFVRLDTVGSTNNYIKEVDEDKLVVTADFQLEGRGQGNNYWESERGKNLLFSVKLTNISIPANKQYLLSMVGALALKHTLDNYADGFTLKWPNDIYWKDKKISGTIIETKISKRIVQQCIYGVGINVNQESFTCCAPNPVSLCHIVDEEIDRDELLQLFLCNFDHYISMVIDKEEDIVKAYNESLYRKDGFFRYEDKDGLFEAKIIEVQTNGYLVLCDRQEKIRKYELKEVKFII